MSGPKKTIEPQRAVKYALLPAYPEEGETIIATGNTIEELEQDLADRIDDDPNEDGDGLAVFVRDDKLRVTVDLTPRVSISRGKVKKR